MASLGSNGGSEETASFEPDLGSGCSFIGVLCSRDRAREILRIEGPQIVETFADADGVDGKTEPFGDGNQDTAARRTVQLRHHDAGDARDLLEDLDLFQRVL